MRNAYKIDNYWERGGIGFYCSDPKINASKEQIDLLIREGMYPSSTLTMGQASDLLSCIFEASINRFNEDFIEKENIKDLPEYQIDLIIMELEKKN
ncbi:hypothetical protein [Thalassotalea sp. SU-HH00458]|uniref:hypothetical protein n=1 Tax=Thalassotalea sp. SU-HH00458 TaxID=3127657 RepID=UPI00310BCF03